MSNTVQLESSDKKVFTVLTEVAEQSLTIKNMIQDLAGSEGAIPLPNVDSATLARVIEYCEYHKDHLVAPSDDKEGERRSDDISPWDKTFVGQLQQEALFSLILAANFMDIKPLLDLTCKTVANMIKGKTPEEIRKTFNIKNDFTPEEEEQVRKENEWCEER